MCVACVHVHVSHAPVHEHNVVALCDGQACGVRGKGHGPDHEVGVAALVRWLRAELVTLVPIVIEQVNHALTADRG